jgi:hypothetical protein
MSRKGIRLKYLLVITLLTLVGCSNFFVIFKSDKVEKYLESSEMESDKKCNLPQSPSVIIGIYGNSKSIDTGKESLLEKDFQANRITCSNIICRQIKNSPCLEKSFFYCSKENTTYIVAFYNKENSFKLANDYIFYNENSFRSEPSKQHYDISKKYFENVTIKNLNIKEWSCLLDIK